MHFHSWTVASSLYVNSGSAITAHICIFSAPQLPYPRRSSSDSRCRELFRAFLSAGNHAGLFNILFPFPGFLSNISACRPEILPMLPLPCHLSRFSYIAWGYSFPCAQAAWCSGLGGFVYRGRSASISRCCGRMRHGGQRGREGAAHGAHGACISHDDLRHSVRILGF